MADRRKRYFTDGTRLMAAASAIATADTALGCMMILNASLYISDAANWGSIAMKAALPILYACSIYESNRDLKIAKSEESKSVAIPAQFASPAGMLAASCLLLIADLAMLLAIPSGRSNPGELLAIAERLDGALVSSIVCLSGNIITLIDMHIAERCRFTKAIGVLQNE